MKKLVVTAVILVEGGEIPCMQGANRKFDYISYKYMESDRIDILITEHVMALSI